MSLKIGGNNYDYFYGNNSLEKSANTATVTQDGKSQNSPVVPDEGYYTVGGADDSEYDAAYRALMNAARRAGIADPKAQARFAESLIGKPTEENRKSSRLLHTKNLQDITDAEFDRMKGQTNSLILSKQDIASLRQFRQQYIDDGGRILSRREIAPQITAAEKQLVARFAYSTDPNAAINNAAKVDGIADPHAPKTFKIRVTLPSKDSPFAREPLADQALLGYVQQEFGRPKTNLMGDNILHLRDDAKSAGVKTNVLTDTLKPLGNRQSVVIEMTLADKQKIFNLYKKEQAQVNKEIEAFKNAADKTVAQSLMRGFFRGAWNDLKGNAEMVYEVGKAVADPIGTARKINKAIVEIPKFGAQVVNGISTAATEFSKMTPADMKALTKELISKGVEGLENLEGSVLFEKLGEIAGTVAMEVVLFKGMSAATKLAHDALQATDAGATMIRKATEYGQTVATKVARFVSDEQAIAAEKRFFERVKEIGANPNSITNIAVDPELWKTITQIAANKLQNAAIYGGMKFEQFAKEMLGKFGGIVKPHLEKIYRDEMISLNLKVNERDIAEIKDIWRAQGINEKIGIAGTDKVRDAGWAERVEFRQQMNQATWSNNDNKHVKTKDPDLARKISETGEEAAQYFPSLHKKVENMEQDAMRKAYEKGQFIKDKGVYYFFYKFDKPIGYNMGKETQWIRVELTDSPGKSAALHGHPTTFEEARKRLSDVKE